MRFITIRLPVNEKSRMTGFVVRDQGYTSKKRIIRKTLRMPLPGGRQSFVHCGLQCGDAQ
jgi:hypothetical protein